jgi:PAS domain S-box-containing protein
MDYAEFNATINSILRNEHLPSIDESLMNYAHYRSGKITADVLAMVWKNADSGMVITDSDGMILSVNDALCAMTNTNEHTLIGSGLTGLFDNTVDHSPLLSMYANQLHNTGGAARGKHYLQFASGESILAEISIHRLVDEADEVFVFMEIRVLK